MNTDYEKTLLEILQAINRLERKIDLQKQTGDPPIELSSRCPVCGIVFNGPMAYVCPRSDCPTKVSCDTVSSYGMWANNG